MEEDTMTLHDLPDDLAQFIQQELATGKYQSEADLVAEAMRALKEREHGVNGSKVQGESVQPARQLQALKALTRELETLPIEGPQDGFSVRDHDQLLYGKP
jgi:Arc/MetJ-type ribon-helix-helix transcriptional regulator